ncbi:hypothetical protein BST61_g1226 [Cercospora zeina]
MATQKKNRTARPSNEEEKPGKAVASKPVYPGLEHWKTTTSRPNHARLSETSAYNSKLGKFVQQITVKHDDAFRLRPLTFAEGPLRGLNVLLLEPSTEHFPFLDLPPEIRQMIYDELFLDLGGISITPLRRKHHEHRAVSIDRFSGTSIEYSSSTGTWSKKPPSALGLLAVNKQIYQEAASTLYGNVFKFGNFSICQTFLHGIGGMRGFLRNIRFHRFAYMKTKARAVFFKLREAKRLRSLQLNVRDVSSERDWYGSVRAVTFAADCKTMMVALHKSRKGQEDVPSVLDLVRLTGELEECGYCRMGGYDTDDSEGCECNDLKAEREKAEQVIRGLIAKSVGIEE